MVDGPEWEPARVSIVWPGAFDGPLPTCPIEFFPLPTFQRGKSSFLLLSSQAAPPRKGHVFSTEWVRKISSEPTEVGPREKDQMRENEAGLHVKIGGGGWNQVSVQKGDLGAPRDVGIVASPAGMSTRRKRV